MFYLNKKIYRKSMKLSEYKKVVQDIPAIYDDYDVQEEPLTGITPLRIIRYLMTRKELC